MKYYPRYRISLFFVSLALTVLLPPSGFVQEAGDLGGDINRIPVIPEHHTHLVRGVVWSPADTSTDTWPGDPNNANVRRVEFGKWYESDIPLLEAMNVNTVRTSIDFGYDKVLGPIGMDILDLCHQNDIQVIMTVDDAINDLDRIGNTVNYYKDHPAIMMWLVGNEWNINKYYGVASTVLEAAERTETAAQLIRSLDPTRPVATSYGEIDIDADGLRLADTQNYVNNICPSVDVWMLNIYRGREFSNLFDQWRSITTKPMLLGEFGIDAYDSRIQQVDEATQAEWDVSLWDDILRNRHLMGNFRIRRGSGTGSIRYTSIVVNGGGAVFEWNDEWWKGGLYYQQDAGGWESGAFLDGMGNEEYFGIVDIHRDPRQVYHALALAFEPDYMPPTKTIEVRVENE